MHKVKKNTFLRNPSSFSSAFSNLKKTSVSASKSPTAIYKASKAWGTQVRADYAKVQELKKDIKRAGIKRTIIKGGSIY